MEGWIQGIPISETPSILNFGLYRYEGLNAKTFGTNCVLSIISWF